MAVCKGEAVGHCSSRAFCAKLRTAIDQNQAQQQAHNENNGRRP
jgi:hypothetical protein